MLLPFSQKYLDFRSEKCYLEPMKYLPKVDPEIYNLIQKEEQRQQETLMMIPSENIASKAVEEAVGSSLGNKYAEGYPGKRYYQGQQFVDQVETLAMDRAKALFRVPFANVQPHSGSPANFAVYTALLKPGETLMGMSLASGGHLTHGAKMNASSIYFNSIPYETGKDGVLDYDAIRKQVKEVKPKLIVCGYTAYPRLIDWSAFSSIAAEVDAYLMADISHIAGLVAAGEYPSPVPHVHIVTTTTHKTLRGPRGAMIMVTDKGMQKNVDLPKKINSAIIPGIQGGPHMNAIAGIATALKEASTPEYKEYAKQIMANAKALAQYLTEEGFDLVSGGTESHLILVDLRNKDLLGNTVAEALEEANIVLNRNGVPYDPNPPFYPSGIRMGTPGITSRGMKEDQMKVIAECMGEVVKAVAETKKKKGYSMEDEKKRSVREELIQNTPGIAKMKDRILALCKEFPIIEQY